MTRIVVALFETLEAAERAARDLALKLGGIRGAILHARSPAGDDIASLDISAEDKAILHEGIRRDHAVFYAAVPDKDFQAASDVLKAGGAMDFNEMEGLWRNEGWTGLDAVTTTPTARRDTD
jgi:hypothetical protein